MIRIGSRGSKLALWQARWVSSRLKELGVENVIKIIRTSGDRMADAPLPSIGGKGLFTKEIEDALFYDSIDLAVHSLKDLPTTLPFGLTLAAVPEREDPRDAVVGRPLAELPEGARVGTSSPRRVAQLRVLRPDLAVESVRGNLDTRLRKLDQGEFDALLLAVAGLRRLGLEDRIAEVLSIEAMCPAVGQGALGIETRADGVALVAQLDHPPTRAAVAAERALLLTLGGGCQVPFGAHASVQEDQIHLCAAIASADGGELWRAERTGPLADPEALGAALGRELIGAGFSLRET